MAATEKPVESERIDYDDDEILMQLFEDRQPTARIELRLEFEADYPPETCTFGVDDERVAILRDSSSIDDLLAEPEILEWVHQMLRRADIESIEA